MEFAENYKEEGKNVEIINARFLKPLDKETIRKSIEKTRKVITIEDGTIINGLATAIKELIVDENIKDVDIETYAYPDKFIKHGTVEELEKIYVQGTDLNEDVSQMDKNVQEGQSPMDKNVQKEPTLMKR